MDVNTLTPAKLFEVFWYRLTHYIKKVCEFVKIKMESNWCASSKKIEEKSNGFRSIEMDFVRLSNYITIHSGTVILSVCIIIIANVCIDISFGILLSRMWTQQNTWNFSLCDFSSLDSMEILSDISIQMNLNILWMSSPVVVCVSVT